MHHMRGNQAPKYFSPSMLIALRMHDVARMEHVPIHQPPTRNQRAYHPVRWKTHHRKFVHSQIQLVLKDQYMLMLRRA